MPHVYIVVQRIQCKPIVYAIYIIVYVRIKRIWQLLNSCLCISVHFENQANVSKTIPNEYWLMVFSKNTWLYIWLIFQDEFGFLRITNGVIVFASTWFFLLKKRFSIYVTNVIWVKLQHYEMSMNNIRVLYQYYILRAIFMIFHHTKTRNKRSTNYAWVLNI